MGTVKRKLLVDWTFEVGDPIMFHDSDLEEYIYSFLQDTVIMSSKPKDFFEGHEYLFEVE